MLPISNGIKLGINNWDRLQKFTSTWKFKNTLINNQWIKEEI